jgi:hypothetical protein
MPVRGHVPLFKSDTDKGSYTVVVAYDAGLKCKRAIDQASGRLNASSLLTLHQFPDFLC